MHTDTDFSNMDVEARVKSLADVEVSDISHRYKMQEELGSGAQATVYKGQNKKTGGKVAIKVLESQELEDDELFDALRMEIGLLRQLNHPYVVNVVEVVRDKSYIYIIQECLSGGELFEHLLAKGPFKEDYALAIFAQVTLAVEYLHSVDVVHRDLKAENIVFAAKGSPVIKFIDFGGSCTWAQEEGLSGLVGTPQYVAPEVVTGYGEDNPTDAPYGKGCDMWSIGVLLYVMLSKTMPFRAKEVDQLLKQVVKGKFVFKPEDRWRNVSDVAKDLISRLLVVEPAKRLTVQQVRDHPWCAEAVKKCAANLPQIKPKSKPAEQGKSSGASVGGFNVPASLASSIPSWARLPRGPLSGASGGPKKGLVHRIPKGKSREQQYWYAMEISPPTNMQQQGGVKLGADGEFQMENVPEEMRAILADIQKKKAEAEAKAAGGGAGGGGGGGARASTNLGVMGHAPPPPPPPPDMGALSMGPTSPPAPPRQSSWVAAPDRPSEGDAAQHRMLTENVATMQHGERDEAMDTLLLVQEKEQEVSELQAKVAAQADEIESLTAQRDALKAGGASPQPPPLPPAALAPAASTVDATALSEATESRERAEAELGAAKAMATKLTAQLNAVSTLYTEAMQREAGMRVLLEQKGIPAID